LGYFEDAASVGIYSIGYSVAIIGMVVNNAVLSVWSAEAVKEFQSDPARAPVLLGSMAERLVAGLACVWLAITAGGGDIIRLLAAPAFHPATDIVPFIGAAVMFHGIIHIANAIFLLMKRLGRSSWIWISGGILSIVLNMVLIPTLGILGAAISQTVSFCSIALGMVLVAQKLYPLQLNWLRLTGVFAGSLLLAILMFPPWAETPATSLMLKLPVGIVVTLVILVTIAPEVSHIMRWRK
jgi:O-antigen/teichoic acid export membrane protein